MINAGLIGYLHLQRVIIARNISFRGYIIYQYGI